MRKHNPIRRAAASITIHGLARHAAILRWPKRLTRAVTWVVTASFIISTLQPTLAIAADAQREKAATQQPAKSDLESFSDELNRLEAVFDRMNRRTHGKHEFQWQEVAAQTTHAAPPAAARRAELKSIEDQASASEAKIDGFQGSVRSYFAHVTRDLDERGAPGAAHARADDQRARYDEIYDALKSRLQAVHTAHDDDAFAQAVAETDAFLKQHSSARQRTHFDPKRPAGFGPPKGHTRDALSDPAALAAAIGASAAVSAQATKSTKAGELGESDDVRITDAIRAKAEELHRNPVAILNFVRNSIRFVPTYGAMQDADLTLKNGQGNDVAQASLLIALLRASGISSRYVYGSIEVPAAKLSSWVGTSGDWRAAVDVISQGGTPTTLLTSGGTVVAVRVEHTWVEAFVDFVPSRGVVNRTGDTWIPMDPSFKQTDLRGSLMPASLQDQGASLATALVNGTQVGADPHSTTGPDPALVTTALDPFRAALNQISATDVNQDIALSDVIGEAKIHPQVDTLLARTLPYKVQATGARFTEVPSGLRHQVSITLEQVALTGETSTVFTATLPLSRVALSSVELSFAPASDADAATWRTYSDAKAEELPVYLVNTIAKLSVDGAVVQQGGAGTLGGAMRITVEIGRPGAAQSAQYGGTVGDEVQIGLNAGGHRTDLIYSLIDPKQPGQTIERNLFYQARMHWLQEDLFAWVAARTSGVTFARLPSAGIFAAPLSTSYFFGIPWRGTYKSRRTDIKQSRMLAVSDAGNPKIARAFVESLGNIASSLEGVGSEELYRKPIGFGSNTERAIELAQKAHIPLYVLQGQADLATVSQLNLSPDVLTDVANALNAGLRVTAPQSEISNRGWTGAGYVIKDPDTGAANYLIEGGFGGDEITECERQTVPVPVKFPALSRMQLLLLATAPLWLDDETGDTHPGAAVALIALAVVAVIAIAATDGAATPVVAEAAEGTALRQAFSYSSLFLTTGAADAGQDVCGCEPQLACPHKGGWPPHDICADSITHPAYKGCDVLVEGSYFDAITNPYDDFGKTLWEIKTNRYPYYLPDGRLRDTLNAIVIVKHLLEFQEDKEGATACNFKYKFAVKTPQHLAAMALGLGPTDAQDLTLNGCF